jgi:hypothetical protein
LVGSFEEICSENTPVIKIKSTSSLDGKRLSEISSLYCFKSYAGLGFNQFKEINQKLGSIFISRMIDIKHFFIHRGNSTL